MHDLNEKNARDFLKTLTDVDIANSTFLFSLDFDNDPFDKILGAIKTLYDNVLELHSMIENDFKSETGALMPKDVDVQSRIIEDYDCKRSALNKIINNNCIRDLLYLYMCNMEEKKKHTM